MRAGGRYLVVVRRRVRVRRIRLKADTNLSFGKADASGIVSIVQQSDDRMMSNLISRVAVRFRSRLDAASSVGTYSPRREARQVATLTFHARRQEFARRLRVSASPRPVDG